MITKLNFQVKILFVVTGVNSKHHMKTTTAAATKTPNKYEKNVYRLYGLLLDLVKQSEQL